MSSSNQAVLTWSDILTCRTIDQLSTIDIKQLLKNRGSSKQERRGDKTKMIKCLKQNYNVILQTSLDDLTSAQLIVELKLHNLNSRKARNSILIRRLKDGISQKLAVRRWTLCSDKSYINCGSPIKLNKNEFIVTADNGIYKYNIINNTMKKWIDFPSEFKPTKQAYSCINRNDNFLYTYDGIAGRLLKTNYKTKKHTIFKHLFECGEGFRCCFVDNQLHLICGTKNRGHLVFDETKKTLNVCHVFKENLYGVKQFGLVSITGKNQVLMMGCKIQYDHTYYSNMYSYNTINHKWQELELKLRNISDFGCVVTNDGKYVILFGGSTPACCINSIRVIDIEKMVPMVCNIPCPVRGEYDAIIMEDTAKENLIVSGFVRRCWEEFDIAFLFPPKYILNLIQLWFTHQSCQVIHLLECLEGNHWVIPLCDILNNISHSDEE